MSLGQAGPSLAVLGAVPALQSPLLTLPLGFHRLGNTSPSDGEQKSHAGPAKPEEGKENTLPHQNDDLEHEQRNQGFINDQVQKARWQEGGDYSTMRFASSSMVCKISSTRSTLIKGNILDEREKPARVHRQVLKFLHNTVGKRAKAKRRVSGESLDLIPPITRPSCPPSYQQYHVRWGALLHPILISITDPRLCKGSSGKV